MSSEYSPRPADRPPLAIYLAIRISKEDGAEGGKVATTAERNGSAVQDWQAEQALYHAVRFHQGTE